MVSAQILNTILGPIEYAAFGEGPALLCLHGAMGGCDQSSILARTVAPPGYRFIAVSRPGYLGTPLLSGASPEAQADLLAELLNALKIRETAVIAISGGGYAAIHFALRHSSKCRALVLISTCGVKVTGRMPFAFHLLKFLGRKAWFAQWMRHKAQKDPDRAAQRSIPDPQLRARTLDNPVIGPLYRELNASTVSHINQRIAGTLNDVAVTRSRGYCLEKIAVPTLIVHGRVDRIVPFTPHAVALSSRIPYARLCAIENGDHVSIFTHNREIKSALAAFLAEKFPLQ